MLKDKRNISPGQTVFMSNVLKTMLAGLAGLGAILIVTVLTGGSNTGDTNRLAHAVCHYSEDCPIVPAAGPEANALAYDLAYNLAYNAVT